MRTGGIVILDFGGQYTQLIARAIRRLEVFSEIMPHDISLALLEEMSPVGIILSGGPESVYEPEAPSLDSQILDSGIPILGICYGMQWINHTLGGGMIRSAEASKEYGETSIQIDLTSPLFQGLDSESLVWMSHGDSVDESSLGAGMRVIARSQHHVAAISHFERPLYGVQFHPEVSHSSQGEAILNHFLCRVCQAKKNWTPSAFLEEARKIIQQTVGERSVLSFVSGGVDSTFVTALLGKTSGIGSVFAVYIEALMRKGEGEEVERLLLESGVESFTRVDATERFLEVLKGVQDPEEKRKRIGNLFGRIQQEVSLSLGLDPETTILAQGTLYTDRIESGKAGGGKAHLIKSHHNVGCEFIDNLQKKGQIVEPNRLIFKDEVREAARALGLPEEVTERQPFPGPGLGIRIVNSRQEWIGQNFEALNLKVKKMALAEGVDGAVLPIKTVGVQGDARSYAFTAILRAKGNAGGSENDWETFRHLAKKIPGELLEVNRVVIDLSPGFQKEFNPAIVLTPIDLRNFSLLQEIDHFGRDFIEAESEGIAQSIFILFGADPFGQGLPGVALRAVVTQDFMTVTPVRAIHHKSTQIQNPEGTIPWDCLEKLGEEILERFEVGCFVYDITDKPPATTCWE
jgi:GMP synthase (glutamine-hydrolysing)